MKKFILFIFLILTNLLIADDRGFELDKLFNELKNTNSKLSEEIEQKIWNIWSTHPTDQNLTSILSQGSELVLSQKYAEAVHIFTNVIKIVDP